MTINYIAILICGIASMIIGSLWYGPLFGKPFMKATGGCDPSKISPEEMQKMKSQMKGLYSIQFVLSLISALVLSVHIQNWTAGTSGVAIAVCTWFGFVMTTNAGACLWRGKSKNDSWTMFLISSGCQLVTFIAFGLILSAW